MYILEDVIGYCSDPALANLLTIVKRVFNIIQILGPILAIVGGSIAAIKLMSNPDEKKYKNLFKNIIIALLMVFFLPTIIDAVMKLFDDEFTITACWNYSENVSTVGQSSEYVEEDGKTSLLTVSNQYKISELSELSNLSSNASKIIFVGDSRTVGMKSSVGVAGKDDVWSCKNSMGLDWMKSQGIPDIENQITNGSAVVILMGINDLYNADSYIDYLNQLGSTLNSRGAKVYFVSVNPMSRSADYLNDDIDNFNLKIKSELSSYITYIDTNSYLKNNGFSSSGGIHYTATTYRKIYSFIKSKL